MTSIAVRNPNDDLVGVWNWDLKRDRFRSCRKIYRYFDIDPEVASFGVPIQMIYNGIHPEDRLSVRRAMAHTLQNQEHIDLRYRAVSQEHGVRPVRSRGRIFRLPNGEVAFLCGFVLDDGTSIPSQFDTMVNHLLLAKCLAEGLGEAETGDLIDAVLLFTAQRIAARLWS